MDVSLREYIEALMTARDRHLDERFRAQEVALKQAALDLREYKATSNEWRQALADKDADQATKEARFILREEYATAHKAIDQRLAEINDKTVRLEGRGVGVNSTISMLFIILGLLVSLGLGLLHVYKGW